MHKLKTLALGLVVVMLSLLPTIASSQGREVRGIAHWAEGHGNCGSNQGVGGGGNGTGYIADFRINAMYVLEGNTATFHFVGYNGKEFFGPLSGPLDRDGNFDAKARYEKNDEDYELKGKMGATGTFTRLAHFVGQGNAGSRCTATWTVTFQEGASAPPPAGESPHPTTISKPLAPSPTSPSTPTNIKK